MNRLFIAATLFGLLSCCFFVGCAEDAGGAIAAKAPQEGAAVQAESKQESTLTKKLSDLFEKTKASTPSAEDMKKMLTDTSNAAGDAADGTLVWANDTFKMLKDSGGTATDNTLEWLREDWTAMNAWEYQIVSIDAKEMAANPTAMESKLNAAGKLRWECFHVSDNANGIKFFMKRQKKSYLKNIPLKDLMKLVPLLDGE